MPDYSKSRIYKIWSPSNPNKVYIGSTTQPLSNRMAGHRAHYKSYLAGKYCYITSFDVLQFADAKIELIERCVCASKEELIARESHYIRTIECVNKRIENRTMKEYRADNRETLVVKHKEYCINNRGKIAANKKDYYINNKDTILAKQAEKIVCFDCMCEIRRSDFARHKRSKKHIANLETNTESEASEDEEESDSE